jgi:hypothetical protein
MPTRRKILEHWTEVHRAVSEDEAKVTTCCCAYPGAPMKECQARSGHKTPCRCACHPRRRKLTPPPATP